MYQLALLYEEGNGVEQSNSKAQELMTKAANLGYTDAQYVLARWHYYGKAGFSANKSKSLYCITICYSQEQKSNAQADVFLGSLHFHGGGGLKESSYLARHYFERSAKGGHEPAYLAMEWHCINSGSFNTMQYIYLVTHQALVRLKSLKEKKNKTVPIASKKQAE